MRFNPDYTPNPERAVFIHGPIDQALVHRLTPDILLLQSQGRDPITAYIDSPGGNVTCATQLRALLQAPDQSGVRCRLLTVVTSIAASAAADLLMIGDYALAYPESIIHFHGTRYVWERDFTQQDATGFAQSLRAANESAAADLLACAEERFVFRYLSSTNPTSLDSTVTAVLAKVSKATSEIVLTAHRKALSFQELVAQLADKKGSEAQLLRTLITREFKQNGPRPSEYELHSVVEKFLWLRFYLEMISGLGNRKAYQRWLDYFPSLDKLSDEDLAAFKDDALNDLADLWFFFMALCHTLQEGENPLPASDALHLGLIDEVIGLPNTPNLRLLVEYPRDPQ